MAGLSKKEIKALFSHLNEYLSQDDIQGELYLVGGAVMCLVFNARPATQDVDAIFKPSKAIRDKAAKVAQDIGVNSKWLNDAVKGYLSEQGDFDNFLELSHLKVYCAQPEYLLAMKCLAMRIGEEFHDIDDIRYLIRYLNIESYEEALTIITRYYPKSRFPQKTLYAMEELLE